MNIETEKIAYAAALLIGYASQSIGGSDILIDRYTLQSLHPTSQQQDLMSVVVHIEFPASVATVGDAIDYLLQQSGYSLKGSTSRNLGEMMNKPLPRVHRSIGPTELRMALVTLVGKPWKVVENPLERTIDFELSGGYDDFHDSSETHAQHDQGSNFYRKHENPKHLGANTDASANRWSFDTSMTLYQNLNMWTEQAGWRLDWKSRHDYEISHPSTFSGTYKQAIARALAFYRSAPVPLMAKFYDGNFVLVVEPLR